jgi:hypothetical protein
VAAHLFILLNHVVDDVFNCRYVLAAGALLQLKNLYVSSATRLKNPLSSNCVSGTS